MKNDGKFHQLEYWGHTWNRVQRKPEEGEMRSRSRGKFTAFMRQETAFSQQNLIFLMMNFQN